MTVKNNLYELEDIIQFFSQTLIKELIILKNFFESDQSCIVHTLFLRKCFTHVKIYFSQQETRRLQLRVL